MTTWHGFTHDQLSMIASHLAGGGAICCRDNEGVRRAITRNDGKLNRLVEFSHEALGCRSSRQSDESWREWSALYLEKFLKSV